MDVAIYSLSLNSIRDALLRAHDRGVQVRVVMESENLSGKSFVISGIFERYERDDLKDVILRNGGKVLSSISGKLDYLLAGDNMGPAKKEKAEKLGVKIISESDFEKLLKGKSI